MAQYRFNCHYDNYHQSVALQCHVQPYKYIFIYVQLYYAWSHQFSRSVPHAGTLFLTSPSWVIQYKFTAEPKNTFSHIFPSRKFAIQLSCIHRHQAWTNITSCKYLIFRFKKLGWISPTYSRYTHFNLSFNREYTGFVKCQHPKIVTEKSHEVPVYYEHRKCWQPSQSSSELSSRLTSKTISIFTSNPRNTKIWFARGFIANGHRSGFKLNLINTHPTHPIKYPLH